MEFSLVNFKNNFKKNGIHIFPNIIDFFECRKIILKLENILDQRKKNKEYIGDEKNQVLYNFFYEELSLARVVTLSLIDTLMRDLIDDDYVLISSQAKNRRKVNYIKVKNSSGGIGWHTDGRFVGRKLIKPSLCYTIIIALEDFTKENGSTRYISASHEKDVKPDRNENYDYTTLEMKAGSIAIMNTSLWHTAGPASDKSRWSIFNMYGPWFVKPYFRYNDIFDEKKIINFSPLLHKLLHFQSTPPLNQNERLATLTRVGF